MIKKIHLKNYKAFKNFTVYLDKINILVGKNNQGKSTIIESIRLLAGAIRKPTSRKPEFFEIDGKSFQGHHISEDLIPSIVLNNIHTDYNDHETSITYFFKNNNKIIILFPKSGGCYLYTESNAPCFTTTAFKKEFPLNIISIPILSRLEETEMILEKNYVKREQFSHKASRHFRNYWYHFPENFEKFANLLTESWPEMSISPPEQVTDSNLEIHLSMFCNENRIPREIFWSGSGFQIWCQLLTYISRSKEGDLIVLDEPEVFLHPELQRKLYLILKRHCSDIILATHSTEIISESDPGDVVLINKSKQRSQRLNDIDEIQNVFNLIGSNQNISLTKLANSGKILFVEGRNDYSILKRFADKINDSKVNIGDSLVIIESEGFGNWEKIKGMGWGVSKSMGNKLSVAAIFDRDYRCKEEIDSITRELRKTIDYASFLSGKEIENYLLCPDILQRTLVKQLKKRESRIEKEIPLSEDIESLLIPITESFKEDTQSQIFSKRQEYLTHHMKKTDGSTIMKDLIQQFEKEWSTLDSRLSIVPGKEVLRKLRSKVHEIYNVNLTNFQIIDEFKQEEIDEGLKNILVELSSFANQ